MAELQRGAANPLPVVGEMAGEARLRPQRLVEYIGQQQICDNLVIAIEASQGRGEALDHVLVSGPPGLGKTSLAHIIAAEMGVRVHQTSGPVIDKAGDLAAILTALEPGDVLFVDEIHRLGHVVEEVLYPAMEEFRIDIIVGEGPSARSISLDLNPFTLVGATTRSGLLSAPLRSRFGYSFTVEFYDDKDLSRIIERSAGILSVEIDAGACQEMSRRSRGTPRIANRLLRRLRDYAEVKASGKISVDVARAGLKALGVDEAGFDPMDRRFMRAIIEKFDGGPVGIDTLAAAVGEDAGTLEEVYEPYLMRVGFIQRTSRGRIATARAYEHLGLGSRTQPGLFK